MSAPPPVPLPREIIKWLQSLDLSLKITNPKRDLSNGFVVAEIVSRFYPKDIDMNMFENGNRLAAKVDNWEQLYKVFKKRQIGLQKQDFDPVIHCAHDAAMAFLFKLYSGLTKRPAPKVFMQAEVEEKPAFMRDTAAKRLKDHEISRIEDNIERTIRAIDTLGGYHEERKFLKAKEAPLLMKHERRVKTRRPDGETQRKLDDELQESLQIDEVRVKAMTGVTTGIRGGGGQQREQQQAKAQEKTSVPRSAVGALASMQHPALFVKPASDIMRPLVSAILSEQEQLQPLLEDKKDIVVVFMENCRDSIPEEVSVRVFETLANRAQLLVDTLTKSAPEFWKVWSAFFQALTDWPESSPVFESAVFFFKRIGDLMREADSTLTQQLITEVGLPSLAKELVKSPEKRDMLCEIIYSYTQEETWSHLWVLKALKDKVSLPVYVSCLSCLVSLDAQLSLLDEHLLDLYIYYALIAMQAAQPKMRVAGVSILCTITANSSQHESIAALVPQFSALAADEWWEVQAQLLLLSTQLLSKMAMMGGDERAEEEPNNEDVTHSVASAVNDKEVLQEHLLGIISRLFVPSNSKNVLQVGLSALVHLLQDHPTLLPVFVSVLLEQGPEMRQRLLRSQEPEAADRQSRQTYVWGNVSRMYEEKCVADLWPHLDVAKTFAMQLEASPLDKLEPEHMEVFLASLPGDFDPTLADEWLSIFEKVQQYIIIALVDPALHIHSAQILRKFWLCPLQAIASRSMELSKRTLLQALVFMYGPAERARVTEAALLDFFREINGVGGMVQIDISNLIESFRETHPAEFGNSNLDSVFS